MYFVCRTYQRSTKAGACTSHTIKEQTVTRAVVSEVQQICRPYLQAARLMPIAECEVAKRLMAADGRKEVGALKARIDGLTAQLDKIYMDQINGILSEDDFKRIYAKVKMERAALEQRVIHLERVNCVPTNQRDVSQKMVEQFLKTASINRELLFSLIERVELTADRQIVIKFRFRR